MIPCCWFQLTVCQPALRFFNVLGWVGWGMLTVLSLAHMVDATQCTCPSQPAHMGDAMHINAIAMHVLFWACLHGGCYAMHVSFSACAHGGCFSMHVSIWVCTDGNRAWKNECCRLGLKHKSASHAKMQFVVCDKKPLKGQAHLKGAQCI